MARYRGQRAAAEADCAGRTCLPAVAFVSGLYYLYRPNDRRRDGCAMQTAVFGRSEPDAPKQNRPRTAMSGFPKLNFPPVRLRACRRDGQVLVWDALRGIHLVLTPEEWVRQHLIGYLVGRCGALPMRIVQEYPVALNGSAQRADVVVVDERAQPLVLAECKAPQVRIDRRVMDQAVRYNSVLGARYVLLTNGLTHYCYEREGDAYRTLDAFPML